MPPGEPPTFADMEERLYGADLDEFVKERAAAAKELRGQGERGEAAAVAKLPKPTVAAWIVNRVSRQAPRPVGELLDAGARMREVQLGAGSAADLRAAAEAQEAALRALMRVAEEVAAGRGSATAATLEKVRETLHAAAVDAELSDRVRRGVVVREERAVGFPLGLAIPPERRRSPPEKAPAPTPRKARSAQRPKAHDEVAAKRVQRAAAAAQKAQEALSRAEASLAESKAAREDATGELDRARKRLADAERRADRAGRDAERAERAHAKATADAEQALERLKELGGA